MGVTSDFPILPGYIGTKVPSGEFHHKQQTLTYEKGYAVRALLTQINENLDTRNSETSIDFTSRSEEAKCPPTAQDATSRLPKWIEYDRKVLRWFAYFKEAVTGSAEEQYRIRRVTILYYLEDDTLEVTEPKQENSGILQGKFMKRHRIPKRDGQPYRPVDLAVGTEVVMYGRTFYIVGMDGHTRSYLEELGISMAPDQTYPQSPYDIRHALHNIGNPIRISALEGTKSASKGSLRFLEDANKVLRYYLIWDDRASLYGDRRPYRLHYFVEDGTCEILESLGSNSGRDPFPVFLRRGLLPKSGEPPKPGFAPDPSTCYGPSDFRMGTCIAMYGRMFFIHDCDEFTRKWLKENMGSSDEELCTVDVTEPVNAAPAKQLPEYNGFGSLEDSAQNCTSLIPRPPRKDFYKLMNKDKAVLRFVCRLVEQSPSLHARLSPTDGERRFVLSFFMADDTLAIFEPPLKNSGVVGGKYLERRQVMHPGSTRLVTDADLHVGTVIPILQRNFELLDADEFTFQYMENNRHLYAMADADRALQALITAVKSGNPKTCAFHPCNSEPSASEYMTVSQLEEAVASLEAGISKHQIISIHRRLPKDTLQRASISSIMKALCTCN